MLNKMYISSADRVMKQFPVSVGELWRKSIKTRRGRDRTVNNTRKPPWSREVSVDEMKAKKYYISEMRDMSE